MDWRNLETLQAAPPCVATIGFFDGVHRGHQFLMSALVDKARAAGMQSLVITFDRHPRQVVCPGWQPELLSTLDEKKSLLSQTGVDACCVLPFDRRMADLSARDFMQQVLRDRLNVCELVIGYDNRFGHDRTEGFDDYVRYGREMGIEVVRGARCEVRGAECEDGVAVSSSLIRRCLHAGAVEQAATFLGHPYTLTGTVVAGFQEGRKLGFPTANLDVAATGKLVPAAGAYAVRVQRAGTVEQQPAMMNIGTRPTFHGDHVTLEVHLLHFEGDLYGQQLTVSFVSRIREERRFDSVEALARQLKTDRAMAEQLLEAGNKQQESRNNNQ